MIEVHFAQNDDLGQLTGVVSDIVFYKDDEMFAHFEVNVGPNVKCKITWDEIQIHGVCIRYSGVTCYIPTWVWNAYQVPLPFALGLINHMSRAGVWSCTHALTHIHDKFMAREEITGLDFESDPVAGMVINRNQLKIKYA